MDVPATYLQLEERARQWQVVIEQTIETPSSVLGFGLRHNTPVVLKITKPHSDETHSGDILRAFAGRGAVKAFEAEPGAVLLERLAPARQLVELVREGDEGKANAILADVMRQLSHHSPPAQCPSIDDWGLGFDRYLARDDNQVPEDLVHEARELYRGLAASQGVKMLLHGDLQHYNVLFDSNRGWLAIDPKGVIGELEYEVGAIMRNPVEQPEFLASALTIERRLEFFAKALDLNYEHVLGWSFAQAVLSAIWDVEDGYEITPENPALRLAHSLKRMSR